MFNVDKGHCNTVTEKLLYNILELLSKEAPKETPKEAPKEIPKETPKVESKERRCRYCHAIHVSAEEFVKCAKKNKEKVIL
jgi:hypothetical protein